MASVALATLDLVVRDDARPAFPAVYLEGHTVLSCGELPGLAGESGRVLRHALGEEFAVSGVQAGGLCSGAGPRRTAAAMACEMAAWRACWASCSADLR